MRDIGEMARPPAEFDLKTSKLLEPFFGFKDADLGGALMEGFGLGREGINESADFSKLVQELQDAINNP